ncbi:hypothetical protein [Paraburkholderia tropica]|uniref:hypothetical protein n=1 Tax=Paraburkholderia tropica TaxID=92647 RepID=UPI003D2E805A
MRHASARPSKAQSLYFPFAAIPQTVLDVLSETPSNRKDACRIGADAALAFVEALQASPRFAGLGLLPKIAQHFEEVSYPCGVAVGFFDQIDRLLLRGAHSDAQSARSIIRRAGPSTQRVKEAHDPRGKA